MGIHMESSGLKHLVLISLTVLAGMALLILPLPHTIAWCRPAWVFMVVMFWMIRIPHRVGIGVAWFVGLWLDLLTGTLFGLHAFVLALIAYFIVKFQVQVRSLPLWQQTLLVMVLTAAYLALQYWVLALAGTSPDTWKYWLPIVTTTLLWPWVCILLRDFQHRFELG